jgi:DNA repair protein RadA/Sms
MVLVGGEPGIGKSTLLLQVADAVSRSGEGETVLYVSGEESAAQVRMRGERIGIGGDFLYVLSEQLLETVAEAVEQLNPRLLIVDSMQTTVSAEASGEAGSVTQLREVSARLTRLTKGREMTSFLVGHITKEGAFAGPKSVEHLVDVALYMEGSRGEDLRVLRAVKNRFGATDEAAVLQMTADGLREIAEPSKFFLEGHEGGERPGAVVVPVLEGTRPILVEIQALVAPTGGYGIPQRRCTGLDLNRALLLLAVMERHLAVSVAGADVYLSVAGGIEARERAADLGIAAAVLTSLRGRPVPPNTVVLGELGLSGELRAVRRLRERLVEAAKHGYRRAVVPAAPLAAVEGIETVPAATIDRAMAELALD